jgi:hypothetical protein
MASYYYRIDSFDKPHIIRDPEAPDPRTACGITVPRTKLASRLPSKYSGSKCERCSHTTWGRPGSKGGF